MFDIFAKLDKVVNRYNSLTEKLADPSIYDRQEEFKQVKRDIHKDYGWYFLANEVSKFTLLDFYKVMEKPAVEVLGTVVIIKASIEMIK